jgi:hypothetical protein
MRRASVGVAVTPLLNQLPRRVAVAIDFNRASIAPSRSAALVDVGGSLALVYVEPAVGPRSPATEDDDLRPGHAAAFTRLRSSRVALERADQTVVLKGRVVPELLSFAYRAEIDHRRRQPAP